MEQSKLEQLKAKALANKHAAMQRQGIPINLAGEAPRNVETLPSITTPVNSVVVDSNLPTVSSGSTSIIANNLVFLNTSLSAQSVELTPQQFTVVEKIEQVRLKLLAEDPAIETSLKQIHTALHKDPELVHFLTPEQIGVIVKGLMQVTKTVIVATAVKKSTTASGKKLSQLTLDDL